MTLWTYATNLRDATLAGLVRSDQIKPKLACADQFPDVGEVVVIVLCRKVEMVD
jgi:hypothetical protein